MTHPPSPYAPPTSPPRPEPAPEEGFGGALFGGAVAALVGAGAWTLLVKLTEMEIGWAAWGVGALVGLVMAKMTAARSGTLGVYAALLAALGLATGKVMTVKMVLAPLTQEELVQDEEILTQAFAWDMRMREIYTPEVNQQLLALGDDTIPDVLWANMLQEAGVRLEAAPEAERRRVAGTFVTSVIGATSLTEQFLGTLSPFDFLWFFLAIGTAWKMMKGD